MRILVIKPSSLGDVVHTFPAVRRLRRRFPDAEIAWVANSGLQDLPRMSPDVTAVIPFPREAGWNPGAYRGFLRDVRAFRADVAVDFQGLLRSGLTAVASGARRRYGFRRSREGAWLFYTDRVEVPAEVTHAVERNVFLAGVVCGEGEDRTVPSFDLQALPEAVEAAERLLGDAAPPGESPVYVAVAPAARWETKVWPAEAFAVALDTVAAEVPGIVGLVIGSAGDRGAAAKLAVSCRNARVVDLTGRTDLPVLSVVLRRADAMLTNDSGPMHLAAAVGTPVVAVFGPTDPDRTGPYGCGHVVIRGQCPDAPCFRKTCPGAPERCWLGVDPVVVGRELVRIIRRTVSRGMDS